MRTFERVGSRGVIAVPMAVAYVATMFYDPVSLAIIGAEFAARGAARRMEIAHCRPGEALTLRRERSIIGGHPAVGVYSEGGVQIGYVTPDAAGMVAGQLAVARAIFVNADTFGAVARITFDGSTPTLPQPKRKPERIIPAGYPADDYCDIFPNWRGAADLAQRTTSIPTIQLTD